MTRKNAAKVAARARQARFGGKYHSQLRQVEAQTEDRKQTEERKQALCASCAPMYGYEPAHPEGLSLGGECFGCVAHHEVLGVYTVPNPAGGFPSKPLSGAELKKRRRIVPEEDSFGAFADAFGRRGPVTPPPKDDQRRLCPACREPLQTRVIRELAEPDDDATEGQMADHFAAEESGDWADWVVESVEEFCPRCELGTVGAKQLRPKSPDRRKRR